ncbi:MAG: hypothetical protein JRH20_29410, partial [Deltaproteobacteria bacterium]|nr:hypothetical protein [Deltaproteobacteria bacterium]
MTLAKTRTVLLGDLRQLIEQSRGRAAVAVNSELVLLYWRVGRRIRSDLLGEERAEYGKQIVRSEGGGYPKYVKDEVRAFIGCGLLQHGFARFVCKSCG